MSKASVITLSVLLLVGLVAAVTIGVLNYVSNNENGPNTSTKAVQEMCQPTDYKEACFKSLGKVNSDDPKELVRAAFESTKGEISEVANKSKLLKELEEDPKTAEAVKNCKELFQDAIDDLQRSFEEIGGFDINKVNTALENIKIWLSATMTYQETCLDGFDNTTGDASEKVRKALQTAMQMSSNGLAIVNEMSNLLGTLDFSSFNRRRLLSDDRYDDNNVLPKWLKSRRLLSNDDSSSDSILLEDDEPDRRRRRLLSSVTRVVGHDSYELMPVWLNGHRRKLLEAPNLTEDLKAKANVVVVKDGSGKYKTIEEAFNDIPKYGNESFIIYVKEGVYNEYLVLYKWMTHVVLVGDGPTKTRITNNKNFVDGTKTFKTATLSVLGDFFMAKDIGIENSAGAIKHQAVALRVQSDQSIFYNCHMDGYQDTLYTHTYRQFYRDCRVTGTIDFIFGDAAAFFQNCTFVVRKPLENQRCIVTAQGRMERHQPTGIIIHKCRFEADPEYYPVRKTNTAYLGRPWKEYSKTIIMESYIDDLIAPEGWLPWEGTFGLETCYYGEYNNVGPGSDMSNRVTWRGIKHIVPSRAEKLMPPHFYESDDWIRASGVPYDPTLSAFAPAPGFDFDEDPNAPQGAPYLYQTFYPRSSSSGTTSSSTSSSDGHSSSSSSSGHSSSSSSSSSSTSSSLSSSSSSDSFDSESTSSKGSSSSSLSSLLSSFTQGSNNNDASTSTNNNDDNGSSSSSLSSFFSSFTKGNSNDASTSTNNNNNNNNDSEDGSTKSSSEQGQKGATEQGSNTSTQQGPTTPSTQQSPTTPSTQQSPTTPSTQQSPTTPSTQQSPTTPSTQIIEPLRPTSGPTFELSPLMAPLTSPSPSPSLSPNPTPNPISTELTRVMSPTTSIISSPSPSPTQPKRKLSGPVTIHDLERMLLTNEELGEEEDEAVNDDMSGNVPDGDEPGPSMVPAPSPTTGLTPTPSESIAYGPGLSPSASDDILDGPTPAAGPGPGAELEPADKMPPTQAPPKSSNAGRNNIEMTYKLHVILSSMLVWVVLAM